MKKIVLLASFAIIAGSGILYAFNSSSSKGSCCDTANASCSTEQTCGSDCSCGSECEGTGCDCGCTCCE